MVTLTVPGIYECSYPRGKETNVLIKHLNIMVRGLGHWRLGSATGWWHLLDILAEIKVHTKIGCGQVYLVFTPLFNHFVAFWPQLGPFWPQKLQM